MQGQEVTHEGGGGGGYTQGGADHGGCLGRGGGITRLNNLHTSAYVGTSESRGPDDSPSAHHPRVRS